MKRSFNSFYLIIINKEKKDLKFGSEEICSQYYISLKRMRKRKFKLMRISGAAYRGVV
jgi:hypothetical protein